MNKEPHRWQKGESGNPKGHKQTEATKQKIREQQTGRFGAASSGWKGGRYIEKGYVLVKLTPDDFFYSMTKHDGYVFEHRLVVARSLGRCLHRFEVVHHKNHVKSDNRIENLQLVSDERHQQITILENRIKDLENQVRLLQWQVKEYGMENNISLRKERSSIS